MTADTLKRPLTPAERELTQQYHHLIYRVMRDTNAYTDAAGDLYGDCALALILAAQRYMENESLHKYRFTTIAYSRIRNVICRHKRTLAKRPVMFSLDADWDASGTLYDITPDPTAADPATVAASRHLVPSAKDDMRRRKFRVLSGGLLPLREAA